jgi:hypothetical protein
MRASLVACDCRELHKKSELKEIKYGYIRGCPKRQATQIGSLKILGVKEFFMSLENVKMSSIIFKYIM